ncbi:MAG: hypothetical protein KJ884_08110 [Gammaproteobacteria bacterium]|nr:hypothetical protein [Gammaproteobacteria bacterium]MBU1491863.1 hypothetical protein [Gammaproteobacteria bacterium]MBU2322919.1 hypothetical protein [Gammaproteobacteria bacterium]
MKKLIAFTAFALLGVLYVGYYESLDDAEVNKVFFIKKSPTLQIKFRNLFANDADDKPLAKLTASQREQVIDYCKYRLGIETTLSSQEELEACKQR